MVRCIYNISLFITICGLITFSQLGCTSYKLHLDESVTDWAEETLPDDQKPFHQVYLLGDAGDSEPEDTSAAIRLYQQHLSTFHWT